MYMWIIYSGLNQYYNKCVEYITRNTGLPDLDIKKEKGRPQWNIFRLSLKLQVETAFFNITAM